jgi:hypothetical protein
MENWKETVTFNVIKKIEHQGEWYEQGDSINIKDNIRILGFKTPFYKTSTYGISFIGSDSSALVYNIKTGKTKTITGSVIIKKVEIKCRTVSVMRTYE